MQTQHRLTFATLCLLLGTTTACTSTTFNLKESNLTTMAKVSGRNKTPDHCQLTLQMFVYEEGTAGAQTIAGDYAAYNNDNNKKSVVAYSQRYCIKTATSELELPNNVQFYYINESPSIDICVEGTSKNTTKDDDSNASEVCTWNGHFRDELPIDFVIASPPSGEALSGTTALSEYINQLVVMRNGDLVYRWNANAPANQSQHTLVIPGVQLQNDYLPNLADLDLRVLPANTTQTPSFYSDNLKKDDERTLDRLTNALGAVAKSEHLAKGQTPAYLRCLQKGTQELRQRAEAIAGVASSATTSYGSPSAPCQALIDTLGPTKKPLVARYKALQNEGKSKLADGIEDLQKNFTYEASTLKGLAGELRETVYREAQEFWQDEKQGQRGQFLQWAEKNAPTKRLKELETALTAKTPITWPLGGSTPSTLTNQEDIFWVYVRLRWGRLDAYLTTIDEAINASLTLLDASQTYMEQMVKDIKAISKDQEAQFELYLSFANQLQQETVFEPRVLNPAPQLMESVLEMEYADELQGYFLGAWNTLVVPVSGDYLVNVPELSADNIIPAVDIIGGRYQYGKSRFGDVRFGLGVILFYDTYTEEAAELLGLSSDNRRRFNSALQANIGLANFRFGVALAYSDGREANQNIDSQGLLGHVRFMIGVDLYKLISGENLEAASF